MMSRYVLIKIGLSTFPGLHPSGHWHRWCNCPQRRSLLVQVIRPLKVKPFRPRYHLKFSTFKKISHHQTFLTISLAKKKWRCVTTPGQEKYVSLVKLDAFIQQTGRMLCFFLYRKRLQRYHCCIGFSSSKQNKECICLLLLFCTHVLPWISFEAHLHCPRWTKGASKQSTSRCICIRLHQSLYLFVSPVSPVCLLLQPFLTLLWQSFTKLTHRSLPLSQPHGDALLEQALRLSNTLPVVFLYLRRPSATSSIEVFFAFRMEQAERDKTANV